VRLNLEENAVKLAGSLCEKLIEKSIIPVINGSTIILDDSSAGFKLSLEEALSVIRSSLIELRLRYRSIAAIGDEIRIDDEGMGKPFEEKEPFLICPHCGFITLYEEEYWIHLKSHYLGV